MPFIHYFQPNPVLGQMGPITMHWYGLTLALALIAAVAVGFYLSARRGLKSDDFLDLILWVVIAGIIGARLYDVFIIDWAYFSRYPDQIFYIWQGGLAIHGAIIAGAVALYFWCKYKKQNAWQWLDIIAIALPLGQAIGRWGNYFNSELFGGPTNLPWGIPIVENLRPMMYKSDQYFHPAFLYESLLNLILFAVLFLVFKYYFPRVIPTGVPPMAGRSGGIPLKFKGSLRFPAWAGSVGMTAKTGQFVGLYLIGYGIIRFIMEFVRLDATAMLFNIRLPQLVSILLIFAGLVIFWRKKKDA